MCRLWVSARKLAPVPIPLLLSEALSKPSRSSWLLWFQASDPGTPVSIFAWFRFLKFSFPRTLKYHPCYYPGTCFVTHTRICVHSSRTIYAILPFNDKLMMLQWVPTFQVLPSLRSVAVHFYKPCRRHIGPQGERRNACFPYPWELQDRDEGAAQDSLVNGTNFHKLQCIKLIMCWHMNRALNTGRIPILRITPPRPLICPSAVSNPLSLLLCCFLCDTTMPLTAYIQY